MHILTTSREALRAEGEYVQRLEPVLACLPTTGNRAQALGYPALQLLLDERAMSHQDSFCPRRSRTAPGD